MSLMVKIKTLAKEFLLTPNTTPNASLNTKASHEDFSQVF